MKNLHAHYPLQKHSFLFQVEELNDKTPAQVEQAKEAGIAAEQETRNEITKLELKTEQEQNVYDALTRSLWRLTRDKNKTPETSKKEVTDLFGDMPYIENTTENMTYNGTDAFVEGMLLMQKDNTARLPIFIQAIEISNNGKITKLIIGNKQ